MNLPLVLDISIGLIFIYLILSLLASEIQELLATLLQWRAEHLRRSIENLLSGGDDTIDKDRIKVLVDDLYNNPLIRTINQASREGIAALFRQVVWVLGSAYRMLTNKKTTSFGQEIQQNGEKKHRRSAPSYISSETFATTLLTKLNLENLTHKLSIINLLNFKEQEILLKLNEITSQLTLSEVTQSGLKAELKKLEKNIEKVLIYFKQNKLTLLNSINRIEDNINQYIEDSQTYFKEDEANSKRDFVNDVMSLKKDIFINSNSFDELTERLKPGLTEIIDVLEKSNTTYKEIQNTIQDSNSEIYKAYQELETDIQQVLNQFPQGVRKSLSALAIRAQIKAKTTGDELNQFKKEVEVWFDQSMDRASGVYKRNAKGVAFLIGCFIAYAANADTLHIIGRLSKDTPLRDTITQNSGQVVLDSKNCPDFDSQSQSNSQIKGQVFSKLDCIRNQVNQTLDKVTLPIGRSPENLKQQEEEGKGWQAFSPLRRFIGWIISGLAISMGAPFWFELLSKIMNVRNTGPKPASTTEK